MNNPYRDLVEAIYNLQIASIHALSPILVPIMEWLIRFIVYITPKDRQ